MTGDHKATAGIWRSGAPPILPIKALVLAALGGALAVALLALGSDIAQWPLVLGSFGASCVLLFGYPDSPFAQPRSLIGGHLIATATGLVFLTLFGAHWWSMALAEGGAIALMHVTRTVHPPAGSNPLIVMLGQPGWSFLVTPTLAGVILLQLVALAFHRATPGRHYPKYWC